MFKRHKFFGKFRIFGWHLGLFLAAGAVCSLWLGGDFLKIGKVKADWWSNPNTNIDASSTNHWAWNDVIGWIDFYNTEKVFVQSREIKGYANSSVGPVSLNCDTTGNPDNGDFCGTANYKVKNDGGGNLSGWAWNDLVGWISFCGTSNAASSSGNCPYSAYPYHPALAWCQDSSSNDIPPSDFGGAANYAWSDVIGWISFNAGIPPSPPGPSPACVLPKTSDPAYENGYKVRSGWYASSTYGDVYSSVFDTGVVGGAKFNSVGIVADVPDAVHGTAIFLQFASECSPSKGTPPNCTDNDWKFIGDDGTTSTFYKAINDNDRNYGASGMAYFVNLKNQYHNNSRYYRYRLRLKSNNIQSLSPIVYDVVVNWSP